ncbi:MAG: metalloregulator ArsR/SmtB family transcription factor [Pseudomonadota bacterium]
MQEISLSHVEAAQGFAAVGSEPRLEVLLALVRAGESGLTVGEIQDRVGQPGSTLSHHLRFLSAAGLIEQERNGRSIIQRAAFEQIRALANFLLNDCCADAEQSVHGNQQAAQR